MHQMVERRHDREAERVDAAAVVHQVHVEAFVAPLQLLPERVARAHDALEDVHRQWPRRPAGRVDGRTAPAIDRIFDVTAGNAFVAQRVLRPHQVDVGTSRWNKGKVFVVGEQRPHDDRTGHLAGLRPAQPAPGVKDAAVLGEERVGLAKDLPLTRALFRCRLHRQPLVRKVEGVAADEFPLGVE
jgi:hypothetical protein